MNARRARIAAVPALASAVVLAAACGSSGNSNSGAANGAGSSGGGLPATVNLVALQDMTGSLGAVGTADKNGFNLAVQQINQSHLLGKTKLAISYRDTATSPTQAAAQANEVAGHYPIVFAGPSSTVSVAEAPLLARANQVSIFTQAGSKGVLLNKYIYRMTTLQTSYYPKTLSYLKDKNVKTVAALTDADIPTETELTQELSNDGSKYGYKVIGNVNVLQSQSDIASEVSKVVAMHPDAIALNVALTQNATAATALKQNGFNGVIVAEIGAGNKSLNGAGSAADGIVWTTDWNPGAPGQKSTSFQKAYEAAYGSTPGDWAAEAYDAMYFAALGLKKANSVDEAKIQSALNAVGAQGFDGVLGHITVSNGQEQTSGYLVVHQGGQENVMGK